MVVADRVDAFVEILALDVPIPPEPADKLKVEADKVPLDAILPLPEVERDMLELAERFTPLPTEIVLLGAEMLTVAA